jgi:CRP-like cAMP-binding protein
MAKKPADINLLRSLSPISGVKPENLTTIASKSFIEDCGAGRFVFKQGDTDKRHVYVISGELELRSGEKVVKVITGGSDDAKHPLAPQLPRMLSARAKTNVEFLAVDSDLLDIMLTWDQTSSFEVDVIDEEDDDSGDWMTAVLASKAFLRVPPGNIQAMFMRMEPVTLKTGESAIKQGEDGDYFYVITEGTAAVTRETPMNKDGIKLAELGVGDTFGEEALISEAKRNATVTMITDGKLMRLSKTDFSSLLHEPLSNQISYEDAKQIVADGGLWLDVRLPGEFETGHEEGAMNLPLPFVRMKYNQIPTGKKLIVCCDTGRRSAAASYILAEKGFETLVLDGGLQSKPA